MRFKKIIRLFEDGNVSVCGMRGRGKDLLMANVISRRKDIPYVSNIDYGGEYNEYDYNKLDVCNGYDNFIKGDVNKYVYPYPDGTDVYLSDAGIYYPSQYCNELNKKYPSVPVFMAISRHVGKCNFHFNAQNLNRVWDKIREQSDTYILCRRCIYIPLVNIVLQWVTVYDRYQSAVDRQKPLLLPIPLFATKQTKQQAKIALANYEATHGVIKNGFLIYKNKSKYDTRRFKDMLANGREVTK